MDTIHDLCVKKEALQKKIDAAGNYWWKLPLAVLKERIPNEDLWEIHGKKDAVSYLIDKEFGWEMRRIEKQMREADAKAAQHGV